MKAKKSDSTAVQSVRIEREVLQSIREAARRDHRSISQQISYYLEIGMKEAGLEAVATK